MHRVLRPLAKTRLWLLGTALVAASLSASTLEAADSSRDAVEPRPVSSAYAESSTATPDFQKHVVPLLGRLGCNGRACHGSFQGQGGFQLSLFGYDFAKDHKQITDDEFSRIDRETADWSMLLEKPTLKQEHGGGKRLEPDSWQFRLLERWISAGTPSHDPGLRLEELDIEPKRIVFDAKGDQHVLRVIAHWSDGTSEDVTELCRFHSNDTAIAEIDENGRVTAVEAGDTHLVVSYDNAVVPIPVFRPVTDLLGDKYPEVHASTKIDRLVIDKLRTLGVVPSEVADDATFLRRVSLDLTGTLPLPGEVTAFLADTAPDKRTRKIEELLESPAYAAWWATQLSDWTGNNPEFANLEIGRDQVATDWYEWIRKRIADNTPYDELVANIVVSASREQGESYEEYCKSMRDIYHEDGDASFADRATMPHYWARNNFRTPEDRAIGFAYSFMGVRIQCAQCHKHPFDQWTQDDFKMFESFFTRVNYGPPRQEREEFEARLAELGNGKMGNQLLNELGRLMRSGDVVPLREVAVIPPRQAARRNGRQQQRPNQGRNQGRFAPEGRVLGGETIDLTSVDDPRVPLVAWLRSPENPYFAKAFVNRVWATYFHVGIVNPPDDLSRANAPSNAPLLDYLAEGFIKNNFDMKWLHREIVSSDTYQRSWHPNETNKSDLKNFSHAIPRRMHAEAAYDAVQLALASDPVASAIAGDPGLRAIGIPGAGGRYRERIGRADASFALEVFGRSERESNCDCDRSSDASLLQTVYLQNDAEILDRLQGGLGTWMSDVRRALGEPTQPASGNANAPRSREQLQEQVAQVRQRIQENTKAAERLRESGNAKAAKEKTRQVQRQRERLQQLRRQLNQNNNRQNNRGANPSGIPVEALQAKTELPDEPQQLIEQAYLRTLSRFPTPDEATIAAQHIAESDSRAAGVEDLLWALLNTKEFIINR